MVPGANPPQKPTVATGPGAEVPARRLAMGSLQQAIKQPVATVPGAVYHRPAQPTDQAYQERQPTSVIGQSWNPVQKDRSDVLAPASISKQTNSFVAVALVPAKKVIFAKRSSVFQRSVQEARRSVVLPVWIHKQMPIIAVIAVRSARQEQPVVEEPASN